MPFGLNGFRGAGRIEFGVASRELLPLAALVAETASAGLTAPIPSGPARAAQLIAYAELLREIGRRGGQVEMLARAASAAHRARREAGADKGLQAAALFELAETQFLAFTLLADAEAADEAGAQAQAALALDPPALLATRLKALMHRLKGALALAAGDRDAALQAAEALEVSAKVMIALKAPLAAVAALALDRADLLIGLGALCHDRPALQAAETELAALRDRLDPDLQPIGWARTETLRGQALTALGEVAGDAASIAEGVVALKSAVAALPADHSPLDEARAEHALGLALQAMGEACDEGALFDRAVKAFSAAVATFDRLPALPYRAIVVHDGAVCLARRAERRGDLLALEQAEATFRETLKARNAVADPLAWAVTQVALARIYEAQSALRPDTGERADAAFALASALDVFTERGLRTLSAATLVALERMRERA
jgi:tetratricopeptide (TPR) repeat protein